MHWGHSGNWLLVCVGDSWVHPYLMPTLFPDRSSPATSSVLITLPKNEVPPKVPSAKLSHSTTQAFSPTPKMEPTAPLSVGSTSWTSVSLQAGKKSPGISPGIGKTSAVSRPQAEVKGKGPCYRMGSQGSAPPHVLL